MSSYELMFIINPEKEEETEDIINGVKNFIEDNKGKITDTDEWGMRRLAYTIKGHNDGFYTLINFDMESTDVNKVKEFSQKNQDILRYIVVAKEG